MKDDDFEPSTPEKLTKPQKRRRRLQVLAAAHATEIIKPPVLKPGDTLDITRKLDLILNLLQPQQPLNEKFTFNAEAPPFWPVDYWEPRPEERDVGSSRENGNGTKNGSDPENDPESEGLAWYGLPRVDPSCRDSDLLLENGNDTENGNGTENSSDTENGCGTENGNGTENGSDPENDPESANDTGNGRDTEIGSDTENDPENGNAIANAENGSDTENDPENGINTENDNDTEDGCDTENGSDTSPAASEFAAAWLANDNDIGNGSDPESGSDTGNGNGIENGDEHNTQGSHRFGDAEDARSVRHHRQRQGQDPGQRGHPTGPAAAHLRGQAAGRWPRTFEVQPPEGSDPPLSVACSVVQLGLIALARYAGSIPRIQILDVMQKPPRRKDDSLVSNRSFVRYAVAGFYVGCAVVGIFVYWYVYDTYDDPTLVTFEQLMSRDKCKNWPGCKPKPASITRLTAALTSPITLR